MISDLIDLDDKMLLSLANIQQNYKNHKAFLLEFKKGNRTVEQLDTFLKSHAKAEPA